MTADDFTTTARIIDEHRTTGRWVGDGVRVECTCGHISPGSHPGGPQTDEDNAHRDADRKHAAHVAQVLAAQEPTDAEVEAACAGFYEDPSGLTSWTGLVKAEPRLAEVYREGIRRALSAARAARRDEEQR